MPADWPAQADGLADIDEPAPTDQLADLDEPAPTDQLADIDEPAPADQLAEVDEPAPADDSPAQADELADIDEPAPADQLADVDEPARIGGATVLTDDAETAESLLPEDQVDRTDEGDPATPAEAPVVAASDGESARAVVETAEDPAFTEDDAPSAGVRTVEPKTDPVATQVSDQARPESPPADRPGRQSADARVEVQRAAGPELSVTPGQDSSSDRQPIDQLAAGPLVDLEPLAEPMRQIDLTVRMLAERPAPVADLTALTQAVETGFQTLQEGLSQSPLLHSVDDRLQQVQETLDQLGEVGSRPAVAMPATNGPQVQRPNGSYGPSTSRIVAAGVMLLGWIAVLWFHTGDAKIAISGVIAVNLIGCLLLSGRTDGDRG